MKIAPRSAPAPAVAHPLVATVFCLLLTLAGCGGRHVVGGIGATGGGDNAGSGGGGTSGSGGTNTGGAIIVGIGGAGPALTCGAGLPSLSLLAGSLPRSGATPPNPGAGVGAGATAAAGVAFDGAGHMFIAGDHSIRRLALASGAITVLAGAPGTPGTVDGIGGAARFTNPTNVISDGGGNLFISDSLWLVRKVVVATGEVSTVSPTPPYWTGMATDDKGRLFFSTGGAIYQLVLATGRLTILAGEPGVGSSTSKDGTGTAARFQGSGALVSDGAGSLYVVDRYALRKVVVDSGAVTTVPGVTGTTSPRHLATDGGGTVYAAGVEGIVKLTVASGQLVKLTPPMRSDGFASDGAGTLYFTEQGTLRKLVLATGQISTVDGFPVWSGFVSPVDIASDGGDGIFVLDYRAWLYKVSLSTGRITTVANVEGAAASNGTYSGGLAWDGVGTLHAVLPFALTKIAPDSDASAKNLGVSFTGPSGIFGAAGLALDGAGTLYVADTWRHQIAKVDLASGRVTVVAGSDAGGYVDGVGSAVRFDYPQGLALDGAGNLYVSDSGSAATDRSATRTGGIRKIVLATGEVTTLALALHSDALTPGSGRLVFDGSGNLYASDGSVILRIATGTGQVTTFAGVPNSTEVILGCPPQLAPVQGLAALRTGQVAVASGSAMLLLSP